MAPRSPASMSQAHSESLPERIRRMGFRRWHERELMVAHGWLAACFVAIIVVAAGFELLSIRDGLADFLFDALLIGGASLFGWIAWRRYRFAMLTAAWVSDQAVCAGCERYGFRIGDVRAQRWSAECPKCGHRWTIQPFPRDETD